MPELLSVEVLRSAHADRQEAIRARLHQFSLIPPSEYFYELIFCLMTPQSSAFNADKAVRLLRNNNFINADVNPEPLLHQPDFYIRFHKTKSKHILAAKEQFPIIQQHLCNGTSSSDLRCWLVNNVKGLGWKEASHFLRNIGHRDLAILDRHILRNLKRAGVLRQMPQSLTPKRYLVIEKKFRKFAITIDIPMDELDLLFWSMETGEIFK